MQRINISRLRLSTKGAVVLAASEGVVPAVYLDSKGIPTFGVGVTKWAVGDEAFNQFPDHMPDDVEATVDWVLDLFPEVAAQYEQYVRNNVIVPFPQHEFDALVHFVYNIGEPNFQSSRLLANLNAGNYHEAGETGFHGWLKPTSLKGRRDVERALFQDAEYGRKSVPIWNTDGRRNLKGIYREISHADALEMMDWGSGETRETHRPASRPAIPAPRPLPGVERPRQLSAVESLVNDAARGGAKSRTNWVSIGMGLFTGGGSLAGVFGAVDPNLVFGSVAFVVILGVIYILISRLRKSRGGQAAKNELILERGAGLMSELGISAQDLAALVAAASLK